MAFNSNFIPHVEYLFFMEKEFPASIWVMVKGASLFVGVDVRINQPGFLTINVNISLIDADLVVAYRLNLGALENQTRLKGIQDVEVKISFFILGNCLAAHGLILTQIASQAFPQSITILVPYPILNQSQLFLKGGS